MLQFTELVFPETQSALIPVPLLLYYVQPHCYDLSALIRILRLATVERRCRNKQIPENS